MEELHRKISGLGLIYEKAHEIEQWADYRFTTKEGRIFGLYEDGESILGRFAAKPVTINWEDTKGIDRVQSIAGFVMEIGTDDQPFVFQDDFHLGKFWLDLHTTYQVELTAEECELLVEDLGVPNVRDREGDGEGTD